MGYAINSCTFSGRMQRTPRYGVSPNGTKWVRFTIRVDDSQYNPTTRQWEDTLQFLDCVAFNDDVDYLKKNGLTVDQKIIGTFTLRMEPRVLTDSGTNESRIITVPVFIVKSGEIFLGDVPKNYEKWHSSIWDTQANM